MRRVKLAWPYLLLAVMVLLASWPSLHFGQSDVSKDQPQVANGGLRDLVCKMDVNANWGHDATYRGIRYFFCSQRCVDRFTAHPAQYLELKCLVCQKVIGQAKTFPATYLGKTYELDSQACRVKFKKDPAAYFMHMMWGIPDWLYYVSIAGVLLVSFLKLEGVGFFSKRQTDVSLPVIQNAVKTTDRYDLMRHGLIRACLQSRPFRFVVQFIMAFLFLWVLAAGLFGNQNASMNIAPLLTWTIWWCGLVVLIMYFGKAWCYMCPWDAIAGWIETLRFWKKTDQSTGLKIPWPKALRNVWLATAFFVGLTWIEIGFGVTSRPNATAWLGVAMLVMAIGAVMVFDRKSFCRYGCLVGRVSGLYALFAGVEVRHRDEEVCRDCHTKECIKGSATAYPCPTFEYPGKMATNTYCIQCTECLQACPHENMTVNLRPWAADLAEDVIKKPRSDEAYLALLMLSISGFHGLTMTGVWGRMNQSIQTVVPGGQMVSFTLAMAGLLLLPIVVYAILIGLSWKIARVTDPQSTAGVSYRNYFIRYAYCVLPIALFYHLAHNLEHLLMEGPKIVAMVSDPMGWGWNLFGTATWHMAPLTSLGMLWVMQVLLVGVGHVYSLWAAARISRHTFGNPKAATRSQWPLLLGMIAFSIFSLWLLKQPMVMRTSAM